MKNISILMSLWENCAAQSNFEKEYLSVEKYNRVAFYTKILKSPICKPVKAYLNSSVNAEYIANNSISRNIQSIQGLHVNCIVACVELFLLQNSKPRKLECIEQSTIKSFEQCKEYQPVRSTARLKNIISGWHYIMGEKICFCCQKVHLGY